LLRVTAVIPLLWLDPLLHVFLGLSLTTNRKN
jgi:hypothetical protein